MSPQPQAQRTRVRVKICGITRLEDAHVAADVGADFLGYIQYRGSKRYVPPDVAQAIIAQIRAKYPGVAHVGVFVDEPLESVRETVVTCGFDMVQLHGNESSAECAELAARGLDVIKALRFGADAPATQWRDYASQYYLCDTYNKTSAGGTGQTFDLALIPLDLPRDRMFVAGGLTAANVRGVLAALQPLAVDVSSGVEVAPGLKSAELVRAFINAVRARADSGDRQDA
jgi:phosphoribosylanthranilate isomerase